MSASSAAERLLHRAKATLAKIQSYRESMVTGITGIVTGMGSVVNVPEIPLELGEWDVVEISDANTDDVEISTVLRHFSSLRQLIEEQEKAALESIEDQRMSKLAALDQHHLHITRFIEKLDELLARRSMDWSEGIQEIGEDGNQSQRPSLLKLLSNPPNLYIGESVMEIKLDLPTLVVSSAVQDDTSLRDALGSWCGQIAKQKAALALCRVHVAGLQCRIWDYQRHFTLIQTVRALQNGATAAKQQKERQVDAAMQWCIQRKLRATFDDWRAAVTKMARERSILTLAALYTPYLARSFMTKLPLLSAWSCWTTYTEASRCLRLLRAHATDAARRESIARAVEANARGVNLLEAWNAWASYAHTLSHKEEAIYLSQLRTRRIFSASNKNRIAILEQELARRRAAAAPLPDPCTNVATEGPSESMMPRGLSNPRKLKHSRLTTLRQALYPRPGLQDPPCLGGIHALVRQQTMQPCFQSCEC